MSAVGSSPMPAARHRRLRRGGLMLLALLLTVLLPAPAAARSEAPGGFTRIGSAPALGAQAVPLAAVSSAQTLRVTVALSPRHAAALAAYAAAVADPASPLYGRY